MVRKLLILLMSVVFAVSVSAQTEGAFRMGVRINGGISNNSSLDDEVAFGYGVGWIAEYTMTPSLYLQSGIGLENIAYKDYETMNAFYGQVPVHFGFRHTLSDGRALFVQAGPTFGIGLFGTDIPQYCGLLDGGSCKPEKTFDEFNRFNLELGGRVGMEIRKIRISAGANFGVTKVDHHIGGHTLVVNLGLAYMF